MDFQTAVEIARGPVDPLERLRAEICGWPPALRRRMIEMLDRFDGLAPHEQARKLRTASRNLAMQLECAADVRAPGHAGAINAMRRDDIHAVDLAIARDTCASVADQIAGAA